MKARVKFLLLAILVCLAAQTALGLCAGSQATQTALAASPGPVASSAPTATGNETGPHGDPYALTFQLLAVILITAALGHFAAGRLKQSPVLGEIAAGILVGALLYQWGGPTVTLIRHAEQVQQITRAVQQENAGWQDAVRLVLSRSELPEENARQVQEVLLRGDVGQYYLAANALQLFSSLGVVLLLFLVGLECSVKEMRAVGGRALGVAALGMAGIFGGSYLALKWLFLTGGKPLTPVFLAAALTATSIGITARVFRDLKRLAMTEAKVVLGAAVLDDVLGLILLAVVTGVAAEGAVDLATVVVILLKAMVFLAVVLLLGALLLPPLVRLFATLDRGNLRLIFPFALVMLIAWLGDRFGLATIIGAFAAGLIIEEEYFPRDVQTGEAPSVESLMAPIQAVFAPIFFVLIGLRVDLATFANLGVLLMSLVLLAVILAGKLFSALPVQKGASRLVVAAGMLPRGEVSLIFAGLGKSLGLLNDHLYSVIIIVMLLTTLLTPPLLKFALERRPPEATA